MLILSRPKRIVVAMIAANLAGRLGMPFSVWTVFRCAGRRALEPLAMETSKFGPIGSSPALKRRYAMVQMDRNMRADNAQQHLRG
jgi:hypothetical protein